MEQLYSV